MNGMEWVLSWNGSIERFGFVFFGSISDGMDGWRGFIPFNWYIWIQNCAERETNRSPHGALFFPLNS